MGAPEAGALFEALEGGLLPLLEAVEVVAELGLGAVVASHFGPSSLSETPRWTGGLKPKSGGEVWSLGGITHFR